MRSPQADSGFSLLELLLVLFIVGIFVGITQYHFRPGRSQPIYSLMSTLRYVRNYAVLHQQAVLVCGGGAQAHCQSSWQKGLLAIDTKQRKPIASLRWSDKRCHVQYQGAGFTKSRILFNYLGFAAGSQGSFRLTGSRCHTNYKLIVAPCGRVRLAKV